MMSKQIAPGGRSVSLRAEGSDCGEVLNELCDAVEKLEEDREWHFSELSLRRDPSRGKRVYGAARLLSREVVEAKKAARSARQSEGK